MTGGEKSTGGRSDLFGGGYSVPERQFRQPLVVRGVTSVGEYKTHKTVS